MTNTTTLYRPVGAREFVLLQNSAFEKWPPRLPEQPIFYPVTNEEYAVQIARDWNTKDATNGNVGYVTKFQISSDYLSRFEQQVVGGKEHTEYWIPAEQLEEFNTHIIGKITIIRKFTSDGEVSLP